MASSMVAEIEKVKVAFKQENPDHLKELSNTIMTEAAMRFDKFLAQLSLISYCLYKILSSLHYKNSEYYEEMHEIVLNDIDQAIALVEGKKLEEARKVLDHIVEHITSIDKKLTHYVVDLYDKAKVKQGSRAYLLGLSISAAIELTGADRRKLQEYIGITNISDEEGGVGIGKRLSFLKQVFE